MSWLSDLFSGGGTPAADAANQQNQMLENRVSAHDDAVRKGKKSIDDAFAGFDDSYFDNYGQTYRDAYMPALADQYGQARDKITATLAGNDQLDSTVGAHTLARLGKTYNDNQVDIGNKSLDATNTLKSNVSGAKTNLYNMNASAADPLTSATQAQAAAGSIVSPQSYPGLGNVFGDALSSVATFGKANQNSMNPIYGGGATPQGPGAAPLSGAGSGVWA